MRTALREVTEAPARELVALEAARLDEMHRVIWPDATSGEAVRCPECDHELWRSPNLGAVATILRIMERRSALFRLDHKDGLAECEVQLVEAQVTMACTALNVAIDRASLSAEQRRTLLTEFGEIIRVICEEP